MLIRCKGRIHHSSLQYGAKHPVLLLKHHWITELLIRDAHRIILHGDVSETLLTIRRSFWISKVRQATKTCIRECTTCLTYDSRLIKYPGQPPIPKERVQEATPFQIIGVDYTGSIVLQNPNDRSEMEPT